MDRFFKWFIRGWLMLVVLANVAAIVWYHYRCSNGDLWATVRHFQHVYSKIQIWIGEFVLMVPAILAFTLLEYLKGRSQGK
jgi:hypothetical protein